MIRKRIVKYFCKKYREQSFESRLSREGWYVNSDGECIRYPYVLHALIIECFFESHYNNKILREIYFKIFKLIQKYNEKWYEKNKVVFD